MTPGPWERIGIGQRDGKWWSQIVGKGRGVTMLVDDASAEAAANARAIAALPELIEAARNALAKLDESPIEWGTADKLRRILARIDGEDT